jgi:hypothetical protein
MLCYPFSLSSWNVFRSHTTLNSLHLYIYSEFSTFDCVLYLVGSICVLCPLNHLYQSYLLHICPQIVKQGGEKGGTIGKVMLIGS